MSEEPPSPADDEVWCEECGELGWTGICPACRAFASQPA
jgi:hypothetical protein